MLKIDSNIEQDLRGVIVIAERMSQFESIRAKEFVDFDELRFNLITHIHYYKSLFFV